MRAHIIENGVIANTIEVESLDFMPGLVAAVGEEGIGWGFDGGSFSEPVVPVRVPKEVSPRQIRQALTAFSLRETVESAVAAGSQDVKDWWEFATVFERDHPMVIAMADSLSVSPAHLDSLWIHAAQL